MAKIRTKKEAMRDTLQLKKVSSKDQRVSRLPLGPVGYNSLKTVSGYIYEEANRDLRWPQAGKTFTRMAYDSTIASVLQVIALLISNGDWHIEAPEEGSEESKTAAEFLTWCMNNMEDMSWNEFIWEVISYLQFGFHISEKVYTQVKTGKWAGKYKWKSLPTRSQESISKWIFNDDESSLVAVEQNITYIGKSATKGIVKIPRNKFMHFRYNGRRGNPEGNSPLKGCYSAWKYKTLIEEYEAVGVAKDLGGIPVLGVDVDYLSKASSDPTSVEAQVIQRMQQDAANLHAGEQSYVMVPLAYDDKGKELFKFDLKGVDGGGKQYNTDDIIKRKQNEMLTVFLADVLKLGQDGVGSYALSDSKNNLLTLAINSHLRMIADVINKDLIPQTLALNGILLEEEDMPKIKCGDLEDRDLDILSKFIQRCVSAGAISVDKNLDDSLREYASLPKAAYDQPLPATAIAQGSSRSGDGMKTAGEGTSNSVSDDPDAGNTES